MTISYLNGTQTEVYRPETFGYLSLNIRNITDAANKTGISAGAIAGAMAEENDDYDWGDRLRDQYAVFAIGMGFSDADKNEFLSALEQGDEQAQAWLDSHTPTEGVVPKPASPHDFLPGQGIQLCPFPRSRWERLPKTEHPAQRNDAGANKKSPENKNKFPNNLIFMEYFEQFRA